MKFKNIYKFATVAIAAASLLGVSSCNYLDVVPPEQPGLADAMKDHDHAKGFLYSCYAKTTHRDILPRDYRSVLNSSTDEYLITETWYANEGAPAYAVLRNTQTTTAPGYDPAFWNNFYTAIGQTLLFEEKLNTEGVDNGVCNDEKERVEWLAESRFCRAYYHFLLLRLYGPIPITETLLGMDADLGDYPGRSHFDYCVDWICNELDKAAADLPVRRTESSEMGRADQVVCKALKARLLLYAASDLYNGKFPSAFKNWADHGNTNYETPGYGNALISTTYSQEKWQRALIACREALDLALEADYALFDPRWHTTADNISGDENVIPLNIWVPKMAEITSKMKDNGMKFPYTNVDGYNYEDPDNSELTDPFDEEEFLRAIWKLRYLNTTTQSEKNTEIIWAQSPMDGGVYGKYQSRIPRQAYRYTKDNTEHIPDSWGGVAPTLYSVEHFLNADGTLPSGNQSKAFDLLNNDDFYKADNTISDKDHPMFATENKEREEIARICLNREPRFYAWIGFNGGDYLTLLCNNQPCVLNMHDPNKQGRKLTDRNYSASGFLSMKHVDPYYHWDSDGKTYEGKNSPEVFVRLAELYLNLAECQAECAVRDIPAPAGYTFKDGAKFQEEAIANINKLRDRAYVGRLTADQIGMVETRTCDGTSKTWNIVEWVRNERFIELWDEGQRYFDVRRWVAGDEYFGYGKRRTLNALAENPKLTEFYQPMMANPQYTFHYREYLYPIYVDQVYRNPQMVQNPGF